MSVTPQVVTVTTGSPGTDIAAAIGINGGWTNALNESPLQLLSAFGQSPWLDFIQRDLLESGELDRMIAMWGLRGVTSNPVIFHQAIVETHEYDSDIARLAREGNSAVQIYERLVIDDVRAAADKLRGVYAASDGGDGFVSLEVSPHLARDTAGTIAAAKRLWSTLDRPNVMLKVPGTPEGLTAVQCLLADGINVNVTLLFFEPAAIRIDGPVVAARTIAALADVGVDLSGVTHRLLEEGIEKFVQPYDALLAAIDDARRRTLSITGG